MERQEYTLMHAHELQHWWFRGRRRVLLDLLSTVAAARGGSHRILDFGCGTGGNTPAYATFGAVVGVEPDAVAVQLAGKRGGASYCRASGTQLPFRPGSFETVIASDVLEHIEDDAAALAEMARVLRSGGSVILSVPAHPWLFSEHDAALHHFRRYSKAALREVLRRSGFRVNRLSYWNTTLFPAIYLQRRLRRAGGNHEPRSHLRLPPRMVNEALTGVLAAEAVVMRHLPLPWGLSIVGVAERM